MFESMLAAAGSTVAKAFVERALAKLPGRSDIRFRVQAAIQSGIERHVQAIAQWSSHIQVFGMASPDPTDDSTIDLRLSDMPRQFQGLGASGQAFEERQLLSQARHIGLLGDPGCGKTTTLKRLVRRLLFELPDAETDDDVSFPIVLICREVSWTDSDVLLNAIAGAIGVPRTVYIDEGSPKRTAPESSGTRHDIDVGEAVRLLLATGGAALLVDGIDEVPRRIRPSLERDLQQLARELPHLRIVFTCRSGDVGRVIEGFSMSEILPLSRHEIESVVDLVLDKAGAERFFIETATHPCSELLDRPLFLKQILILFQRNADLPDQPCALYRQTVQLVLRDWDDQRGIRRQSAYAKFYRDEKLDLLSALAHALIMRNLKRFSTDLLDSYYRRIAPKFKLPLSESRLVVSEIQSHTGLIVQIGEEYEFSHLSLQEYLAAEYVVKIPLTAESAQLISTHPSVAAICVALSADPGAWFGHCLLLLTSFRPEAMQSYIHRILQERPRFEASEVFGLGLLRVASLVRFGLDDARPLVSDLRRVAPVGESVGLACASARIRRASGIVTVESQSRDFRVELPEIDFDVLLELDGRPPPQVIDRPIGPLGRIGESER